MGMIGSLSTAPDRRTRKRLATRQSISDAATRLFMERGFDAVTIDDIAEAADVGRVTVFNHFPRKEDMFFDLDDLRREELCEALRRRDAGTAPVEALRLFAHRAIAERRPYLRFFEGSEAFFNTVAASEALKARVRAIRDELTDLLALELAATAGRDLPDPAAELAASLFVATSTVAFREAHRTFRESRDTEKANAAFLAIVDQGSRGLATSLRGSPYV